MSKHGKMYKKALDYYYKGYIEKAINECEKGIALHKDNSGAFLNLKGLLFYFKGNLSEAKKIWQVNVKINDDEVAKKYLEDSKNDVEREKRYKEAEKAFNQMKIESALELLALCKQSDFNCINVNVKLAECYMKKAEYDKVIEHANQVLVIDKFNVEAANLKTELINLQVINKEKNYDLIGKIGIAVVGVGLIAILGMSMIKAMDLNPITGKPIEVTDNTSDIEKDKNPNMQDKKEEVKKDIIKTFPKEELALAIKEKKYDKLCEYIVTWNNEDLAANEKSILNQAITLMDNEGIDYIYLKGQDEYNKGNYKQSIKEFEKVHSLNRLEQPYNHSNMFFLGVSYDRLDNFEKAIKIYDEFINTYKKSDYRPDLVYNLAIRYNKQGDTANAKKYANIIKSEYPSMIYYNDIIKGILK